MEKRLFPLDFLEELKQRNEIVSVISEYVPLKKKGKSFWACCPFHHEKTPSFAVNEEDQYYHCFGCGESGSVIKFIEKYEGISFYDAVKMLAERANMPLPTTVNSAKNLERIKQKNEVLSVLNLAKTFYKSCLKTSTVAKNYLAKRDIPLDVASHFEIGYSPGWQNLVVYLDRNQVRREIAKKGGLIESGDHGDYDVFATRLIFPILNEFGDCIGFTARTLDKDSKFAKYRNSAQSIVFDKSKSIYNIYSIKQLKREHKLGFVVLCEGTMDVIMMYKFGVPNAVACLGTALTEFHAKTLKKYTDKIVLCLDGDSAGQEAMFRSIDILAYIGLEVRVCILPDGLDPDDFLKKYGVDKLKELLLNAQDAYEFKIDRVAKKYDLNDNFGKNKFVLESLKIVHNLPTASQQDIYLKVISDKCSVPVDTLRKDLDLSPDDSYGDTYVSVNRNFSGLEEHPDKHIKAERFVLASLIQKKPFAKKALLLPLKFANKDYQKLFDLLVKMSKQKKKYTISSLFDYFEDEDNDTITKIINFKAIGDDKKSEVYFDACLHDFEILKLKKRQKELRDMYVEEMSKPNKDKEKLNEILQEISLVTKEMKK